jgi:hypothetical protein
VQQYLLSTNRIGFLFCGSRVAAVNDLSRLAVNGCMARGAKRNQVLFGVGAGVAAKLFVMDF